MENKIKVKIEKCTHSNPIIWYRNFIGKEFDVRPSLCDRKYWQLLNDYKQILKSDCTIITPAEQDGEVKIVKGETYECTIGSYLYFVKGRNYKSRKDGHLVNELGEDQHIHHTDTKDFRKLSPVAESEGVKGGPFNENRKLVTIGDVVDCVQELAISVLLIPGDTCREKYKWVVENKDTPTAWEKALVGLTPGGKDFDTPEKCVEWVNQQLGYITDMLKGSISEGETPTEQQTEGEMCKADYLQMVVDKLSNPNQDSLKMSLNNVHHKGLFSLVVDGTDPGKLLRVFIAGEKIKPYAVQLHTHRYPIKLTTIRGNIKHYLANEVSHQNSETCNMSLYDYKSFLNNGNGLTYLKDTDVIIKDFTIPNGSTIKMNTKEFHTVSCSKGSIWIVEEQGFETDSSKVLGIPFVADSLYTQAEMFQINDNAQVVITELKKIIANYKTPPLHRNPRSVKPN